MSLKKAILAAVSVAVMSATAPAKAEPDNKLLPGTFSANVTGATDYRFRGISQTKLLPAIQGGIDWEINVSKSHNIDFFVGTWASNVNFSDGDNTVIEIDFFGGLRGKIENFGWELQFIYYYYPGSKGLNYNFFEVNPSLSYDFGILEVTGGFNYSPNFYGNSRNAFYLYSDVEVPLPIDFLKRFKPAVIGHVGYQWIDRNVNYGTPNYLNWSVGIKAEVEGFELALKYVDTNLGNRRCFGGSDLCNATAVFTISRTF